MVGVIKTQPAVPPTLAKIKGGLGLSKLDLTNLALGPKKIYAVRILLCI